MSALACQLAQRKTVEPPLHEHILFHPYHVPEEETKVTRFLCDCRKYGLLSRPGACRTLQHSYHQKCQSYMHKPQESLLVGSSCARSPAGLWDWSTSGKTYMPSPCLGTCCLGMSLHV